MSPVMFCIFYSLRLTHSAVSAVFRGISEILRVQNVGENQKKNVFGTFLVTVVKKAKNEKFAPVIGQQILALTFGPPKCVFQKFKFYGPKLNLRGLVWYFLSSSKALAWRGLVKRSVCVCVCGSVTNCSVQARRAEP